MNLLHPIPPPKRRYPALLAAVAIPALLSAQVSLYQFSQSVEPYTEITAADGGYSLGVPTFWPPLYNQRAWVNTPFFEPNGQVASYLNPAIGPGYPIGFDFAFNGDVFDVIGVSHSGWISFGKSSDGDQAVWIYAIDHPHGMPFVQYYGGPAEPYKRNRVAGWGNGSLYMQDMSSYVPPGPITSLRIATIGTAPNRVCVIQWKDFLNAYPPSSSRINFQIRLNEADNSVEVRYGTIIVSTIQNAEVQVGLGGQVPEDFNSRKTVYEEPAFLYDWNFTVAGTLNTDACFATAEQTGHPNGSGIPPANGLNFKWTPDVCPPPVWPLTIDQLSFDSGHASWQPTAAGEYEYFVTDTNDLNGPEIASGTTTDPEAYFFGLNASTTYYVFVRSMCGGEPGTWSLATVFETLGGGMVVCDGSVMTENYCSKQYNTKEWLYISADGSPLKIEFLSGYVSGPLFQVWNGTSDAGTPAPAMNGDLTGYEFNSGSSIFIRLVTDAGACEAQSWYLPLQWRVGCKNCQDPLVSFTVQEDCDNLQYYVNANIFNLGSSSSLVLNNNLGVPSTTVSSTGNHLAGPFPAGQSVIVTAQNPDNQMCYAASASLLNAPCAVQDCGPTTYTYCYADNETSQWAYQGESGQEIGIRFIRGTVGLGDDFFVYNGLDIDNLVPTEITAGYQTAMANKLFTSAPPSTDHAIVMELVADGAVSCITEDPLFGAATEWEYVVACYDGCTQPQATFSTACVSTTQYEVVVNITNIGSTGSAQITNNGGAATVAATAAGTYTVGPFNAGTPVTVEVEGASVLCTWTSPALVQDDCSGWEPQVDCEGTPGGSALPGTPCTTPQGEPGVWNDNCECMGPDGIAEGSMGTLHLFPNPSTGRFTIELPADLHGTASLRVTDVSGRIVARQDLIGTGITAVQLPELPNGLYALALESNRKVLNGTIIIQH